MKKELAIGIDLGGTNCRLAQVYSSGEIGESRRMSTAIQDGLEPFLGRLFKRCQELLDHAQSTGCNVLAMGIGVPGVVSKDGTVNVSPNLPPLNGVSLPSIMTERFGLPVTAVNDANAITWGEFLFGAGQNFNSFLTITLGTGVGGGLVLDGSLWEGSDCAAGEIGHITVEPAGRACGCGSRGCLEQYASATGIVKTVRRLLTEGQKSTLSGLKEDELTCQNVAEAARLGDSVALSAMELAGTKLGQVLADVANLLNIDGVVVTGGASESLDLMLPSLEKELYARAFQIPASRLKILRGQLGDDAGILGAARLGFDRLKRAR